MVIPILVRPHFYTDTAPWKCQSCIFNIIVAGGLATQVYIYIYPKDNKQWYWHSYPGISLLNKRHVQDSLTITTVVDQHVSLLTITALSRAAAVRTKWNIGTWGWNWLANCQLVCIFCKMNLLSYNYHIHFLGVRFEKDFTPFAKPSHGIRRSEMNVLNVIMAYSTTICKLVDLIPTLHQSDCQITN